MKRFLNLSNGVETIPSGEHFDGFVRIQSSQLESKCWDKVIMNLDANFLMWATAGPVTIVDGGSRCGEMSRAMWQGVPWITFCLEYFWFDKVKKTLLPKGGNDVTRDFLFQLRSLSKDSRKKLKYFRNYTLVDSVQIFTENFRAKYDGKKGVYRDIWEQHNEQIQGNNLGRMHGVLHGNQRQTLVL